MKIATTTPNFDKQIVESIARERRERFERLEQDATRYNVLKDAGSADHAAISADAKANGGDFDAALDRYAANLIRTFYAKARTV